MQARVRERSRRSREDDSAVPVSAMAAFLLPFPHPLSHTNTHTHTHVRANPMNARSHCYRFLDALFPYLSVAPSPSLINPRDGLPNHTAPHTYKNFEFFSHSLHSSHYRVSVLPQAFRAYGVFFLFSISTALVSHPFFRLQQVCRFFVCLLSRSLGVPFAFYTDI